MSQLYQFQVSSLEGSPIGMETYRGKVLLIVNVASHCGFTPQYKGLEALYREFKDQGLEVLGFPCNQFGSQEPGDSSEIRSFCETRYEVSFPMFAKIDVNGEGAHPMYQFLKQSERGILGTEGIKWNFTKFLVGRDGEVLQRFAPTTSPEAIREHILNALEKPISA